MCAVGYNLPAKNFIQASAITGPMVKVATNTGTFMPRLSAQAAVERNQVE